MTEAVLSLFTHADDLRVTEPEYFMPNINEEIRLPRDNVQPKNPVMILDEGAKKVFGKSPEYSCTAEGSTQVQEFTTKCVLRDMEGVGKGKTKKSSKQAASAAVLKLVVRKDLRYAKDMGIPFGSIAEADAYLDASLEQVTETKVCLPESSAADFERGKNYKGLVQELLQKQHGTGNAIYEDREEGTGTDLMFIVTCKVGKIEFEGRGKRKKDAQAFAAYLMSKHLETSLGSMDKDFDEFVIDEKLENDEVKPARPSTINPGQSMEAILNDKSKFTSYTTNYRALEMNCSFGLSQSLLTIESTRVGEKEPTVRVFPGAGNTREDAEKQAALNALLFLETF